ncbi:MAG: M28 family metallopeptidase [Candidatus Bathyarchaeia archaeon]
MSRKAELATILLLIALLAMCLGERAVSSNIQSSDLTAQESSVVSEVNGTNAYNYDLELERIALDHNVSGYSFRSAGSPGANATANWIKDQFQSLGLETQLESFQFTNWYLPSSPTLVVDQQGSPNDTESQIAIRSFEPVQYSCPTPEGGVSGNLVVLPLPSGLGFGDFEGGDISTSIFRLQWNGIDTTGKIVLVGREVNWYDAYRRTFLAKLSSQPPLAVIYTYWYSWMSSAPPILEPMEGARADIGVGANTPTAWVSYQDGLMIQAMAATGNLSATVNIPAIIDNGTNYNVIGELKGTVNPERAIIVSGHYDTVMSPGFCDNGAGTAGVIELARVFTDAAKNGAYTPQQSLIFIAFTGEELGYVGSINYIKQHKPEMQSISAVINLDSIGTGDLQVSETFPDGNGLELDQIVLNAAADLGVRANLTAPGDSDQEAFRNPAQSSMTYAQRWGTDPNISDAARVESSTMLSSYPLTFFEGGWIYTEYDNSTSTATLHWIKTDDLEAHIKVGALSVMRFLAAIQSRALTMSLVLIGTTTVIVILAVVVALKRSKARAALLKLYYEIVYGMRSAEWVWVVLLTAFLLFSSYASYVQIANTEVIQHGVPTIVTMRNIGYPFEMIALPIPNTVTMQNFELTVSVLSVPETSTPTILWTGLLSNVALFFLLSFGVVYAASTLRYAYQTRRRHVY